AGTDPAGAVGVVPFVSWTTTSATYPIRSLPWPSSLLMSSVIFRAAVSTEIFLRAAWSTYWFSVLIQFVSVMYGEAGIGTWWASSAWEVRNASFWYGSSCGIFGSSDFRAGRPQPLVARSSAGGPAMKYSM